MFQSVASPVMSLHLDWLGTYIWLCMSWIIYIRIACVNVCVTYILVTIAIHGDVGMYGMLLFQYDTQPQPYTANRESLIG